MKFKVKVNRKTGVSLLYVEGDKDEELGYAEAETLRRGGLTALLPLTYERRGRIYRFTYAAQGLFPLSAAIAAPFIPRQLERMLVSFLDLMLECENHGLMRQRVSADPEHILFDRADCALRFVYVPLNSFAPVSNDLRAAVVYLCEYAQVHPSEIVLRDRVLDHVRRSAVFTSVDFGALLSGLGIVTPWGAGDAGEVEPTWLDTDQLGDRAFHGRDFVSEQLARSGRGSTPERPSGVLGWRFVRLSDGCTWRLGDGCYDVGRMEGCSISLPDVNGLSRRHADITVAGDYCELRDLGSTNGVVVNGMRLAPHSPVVLRRGDRLQLGDELFELR